MLDSLGAPLAKEGSSANYEHTSKFTLASQRSFLQKTNYLQGYDKYAKTVMHGQQHREQTC